MIHRWDKCLIWSIQIEVVGFRRMNSRSYLMEPLYLSRSGMKCFMCWMEMVMENFLTKSSNQWWLNLYVDIQFSNSSSMSAKSSVFVSSSSSLIPFSEINCCFSLTTSPSSLKRDLRHFIARIAMCVSPLRFSVMRGSTFNEIKFCFKGLNFRDNLSA